MSKGFDISKLKKENNVNTSQKEKEGGMFDFLNKDISFGGGGLSDKKKESFYHELSILLAAGIDIKTAFELILSEQKNEKDKQLFDSIMNSIVNGSTFATALSNKKEFTMYEHVSVQIGEETGKLVIVLDQLAIYYKDKIAQKRQIVSSLSYPAIVLCTSFGAIFFMLNFVVPMFSDIFKRFGGKLPAVTQFIIDAADFMNRFGLLLILVIASLIWLAASPREMIIFFSAIAMLFTIFILLITI